MGLWCVYRCLVQVYRVRVLCMCVGGCGCGCVGGCLCDSPMPGIPSSVFATFLYPPGSG